MTALVEIDADFSRLPNFIICGAPKAGTSSLHQWLADHPDTLGSSEKETYFFVDPGTHMYRPNANGLDGLASYGQYFRSESLRKPKVIFESTPSYIYYETALRCIPNLSTAPKCLFVVREPGQQIYSLFTYFRNNWSWIPKEMTFSEYLDLLRRDAPPEMFGGNELAALALKNARYVDFLLRWRTRLGPERIMVRSFEELKSSPRMFVMKIADWLGLDTDYYSDYVFLNDNETYSVRVDGLQKLNVALRARLPKGPWYRTMRRIYRKLNTRKPAGPTDEEKALIERLSLEFAEDNARLRQAFDMELTDWA